MIGEYFILQPKRNYKLTFDVPPGQALSVIKEEVSKALVKDGLKYVSQRIRGDKDLVIEAIKLHKYRLKHFCEELKDDKEVAIALVTHYDYYLKDLSQKFQDDYDVVEAAIAKSPRSLQFASERLRSDKNIINKAVAMSINCLMDVSETVFRDRESMLDLIAEHPYAFNFAVPELKNDQAFIDSAKLRNPKVIKYAGGFLENVGLTLATLPSTNRCLIL